jgi:hypothetical protein
LISSISWPIPELAVGVQRLVDVGGGGLTHPDQVQVCIRHDIGAVALYCPHDGIFHLRPSDGQLMFTRVHAGTWMVFEVRQGGELKVDGIGPVADPALQ